MIIEKPYKINRKTGNILAREIISVKCDGCGNTRSVEYRKYKECKQKGLCHNCSVKKAGLIRIKKVEIKCNFCNKNLFIKPCKLRNHNYCNTKCMDGYLLHRYDYLNDVFANNIDYVSYLFGLILGDGYCKKTQKHTTRISIAFDANHPKLERIAIEVFNKLQLKWYREPKVHHNCIMIGFVLPDQLLDKYSMLYSGNKFDVQPYPSKDVINNLNFAAGLINSDGYFTKPKFGRGWITFVNTVKSIADAYVHCLNANNIPSVTYLYKPKIDKRNGNMPKHKYDVHIHKQSNISYLRNKCIFTIKE